jgi:hypothetical protein
MLEWLFGKKLTKQEFEAEREALKKAKLTLVPTSRFKIELRGRDREREYLFQIVYFEIFKWSIYVYCRDLKTSGWLYKELGLYSSDSFDDCMNFLKERYTLNLDFSE